MIDVIVIGGGISGLGVARRAAQAGYSVVLIEAREIARATSDNTLRIIHGGFRYLQTLSLARMVKSIRDQRDLLAEVPEALSLLPCVMPLNRFGLKSHLPVAAAALFYGAALSSLKSPISWPRVRGRTEVEAEIPLLKGKAEHGVLQWHDVVMKDPSLVTRYLVDVCGGLGVDIRVGVTAKSVSRSGGAWSVNTVGAGVLTARSVVSTLGPWLETLSAPTEIPAQRINWCKGFNLIVKKKMEEVYGVGLESADGRLFFVVPRGEYSAIGTWYVPFSEAPEKVQVTREEIATFAAAFNSAAGSDRISPSDVAHVDVGVLPCRGVGPRGPELLGNEEISDASGYVRVMSTKYTTFRSQGERVVKVLGRYVSPH